MKLDQFARMTRGIDGGRDLDDEYVRGIYERVKQDEFVTGRDHTTSVMEFERQIVNGGANSHSNNGSGNTSGSLSGTGIGKGQFVVPHRRLVCIVQLYEVLDLMKKEKPNAHLRDCFLFNDTLIVSLNIF